MNDRLGIILLNLGGPDSISAVRPFLFNLFSDRDIIRLGPKFIQTPIARLIAGTRSKKTEALYSLIGGKSPILDITTAQAHELERLMTATIDNIKVFVGMRYWHPFIDEALHEVVTGNISKLLAISLYPHYSTATTGSSERMLKQCSSVFPLTVSSVSSWYDHPGYINALVEKINIGLHGYECGKVHLLFSAHSLPVKFIEEGDPYVDHINATIRKVLERIEVPWSLSYQSKSGPVKWLEPSTDSKLEELSLQGVKNILVVPISFVSDHIETLYEIDILYKSMADKLGMNLTRIESLNTSPVFMKALADIAVCGLKEAGWLER